MSVRAPLRISREAPLDEPALACYTPLSLAAPLGSRAGAIQQT